MTISKKIFYLLLFLLPLNLGKHFILQTSFVTGILVDYLIPTIYIQDLLIIILIGFYIYENLLSSNSVKEAFLHLFFSKKFTILYLFLFSIFLSSLLSNLVFISITSFLRLCLYALLFIYIANNIKLSEDLEKIVNTLIVSVSLVSILGIFQFIFKGSVFDNYLFFGEQPYSFSTPGIHKENLFGYSVVPSYGLFRHPNIFAGVLSLGLLLNVFQIRKYGLKRYPLIVSVLLIIISLILTFSISAYISLFLAFISYSLINIFKSSSFKSSTNLAFGTSIMFFAFLLVSSIFQFFPFALGSSSYPYSNYFKESLTRRSYLGEASLNLVKDNFEYGVGIATSTNEIEQYVTYINDVRFLQPVHNVFLLVLSETGIISFVFFMLILLISVYRLLKVFYSSSISTDISSFSMPLLISLLLILFLFLFDHYFWTIHQTSMLFWIVLGLCWTNDLDC